MKKLVFVITLLITFGAQAQDRKEKMKNSTPEERVEMRTNKLSEKLSLDENQKKKVKEIFAAQQKENKSKIDQIKADREKARTEMKKQHEELKAKLKPVLTDEQYKKWEAMQDETKDKVKEGRKHKKR
jgi:periplasmic protein CpxP/Spy